MNTSQKKKISVIVPIHNEEKNIVRLYDAIMDEWEKNLQDYDQEVIFVDDGSSDGSMGIIRDLAIKNAHIRFVEFSRNFGKEIALTAGLHLCTGHACIMIDADLQHPVSLLPRFIEKWKQGAEVVIGVRKSSKSDHIIKKVGSFLFYKIMAMISDVPIVAYATDYRLLDRIVIDAFNTMPERDRITRGLIDWLGFRRETIVFEAQERAYGTSSYNIFKLTHLAFTSIVSMSMFPLWFAGSLGVFIMLCSGGLGVIMFINRYIFDLNMEFSGSEILANITVFLVGIVLICMGLLAFYIGHIYRESQGRQIYVVRSKK